MRKRIYLMLVVALVTIVCLTAVACDSEKAPTEGLAFSYDAETQSYTVTGYTGTDTEVFIPSKYDDGTNGKHSVTSIGEEAFGRNTGLTSVTIGDGVMSIGDNAFYECTCLTSVTIGNGVMSIGRKAFFGCVGLTRVAIPDSVTSIVSLAFSGCTGLTSVTIGNGVTSIGASAFYGCVGLTNIAIPGSVTSIGSGAFHDTAWYNSQPDGLVYAGKVVYGFKGDMPKNATVRLGDGTKGIAGGAFFYCLNLASIIIPDSVVNIGSNAFDFCTGLTSVTIGNGVTCIRADAFCNTELTNVTIPASVTTIESGAFFRTSLTNVTFEDTSTWYRTGSASYCAEKTGGTETDVTNGARNAEFLKNSIYIYYWYKI